MHRMLCSFGIHAYVTTLAMVPGLPDTWPPMPVMACEWCGHTLLIHTEPLSRLDVLDGLGRP